MFESKLAIAVSAISITAMAPLSVVTPEVSSLTLKPLLKAVILPSLSLANQDTPEPAEKPEPAETI